MTEQQKNELVNTAIKAAEKAYAPYSKFRVGAAALDENGAVFTGCNVENASYGLTVCAERIALFKAVSEGAAPIKALAVVTLDAPGTCSPCGACRQVIYELAKNSVVLLADREGGFKEMTPAELMPEAFEL